MSPFQTCLTCPSLALGLGLLCAPAHLSGEGTMVLLGAGGLPWAGGGHFLHGREWVLWLLLSHTFYQGRVKN